MLPAMRFATIRKSDEMRRAANLPDYDRARREFSWAEARRALDGLPDGGLNIAHEAVDRHAAGPRSAVTALRLLGRDGGRRDITYGELAELTSRFANVLAGLGVREGDRVFTLLGRVPELYVAVLGTLKARCVLSPLFAAFGPEPVCERMRLGGATVLVTTPELYRRTVAPIRDRLPDLRHVLLVPGDDVPETLDLPALMDRASVTFTIPPTDPQDTALLHFTSGTTGRPKGALHVHEAVVAHHATARAALDLRPDDIFWCTADPGWVTGMSYGIVAPLVLGATLLVDPGEFDVRRWYRTLADERVTVWYTAPTALRMLMRRGARGSGPPRPVGASLRRQRRGAAQPRGRGLGRGGPRQAGARQLVADRDRRHHDQQLRGVRCSSRVDGSPASRGGGRAARTRLGRASPGRRRPACPRAHR